MPSPIHITNSYNNCHVTHNGPQVNSVANSPPAAPNDKYVSRPEASNVGGSHDGVEEAGNVKDSDDGVKEAGDDKQKKKSKAISDEKDETFVRGAVIHPPKFGQWRQIGGRGWREVVIPNDMFCVSQPRVTHARARAFFDDYSPLLNIAHARDKEFYQKTDDTVNSFRLVLQGIRNGASDVGRHLFTSHVIQTLDAYLAPRVGGTQNAPRLQSGKGRDVYMFVKSLYEVASDVLPDQPLFVQKALYDCVYSVNTKVSEFALCLLPKFLNDFGRGAVPPYIIDAGEGDNQKHELVKIQKHELVKIANLEPRKLKRMFNEAEEKVCGITVRVSFSNHWINRYHHMPFSAARSPKVAYLLITLEKYREVGLPHNEDQLISNLLHPSRTCASVASNLEVQFQRIARELQNNGVNPLSLIGHPQPLSGASQQQASSDSEYLLNSLNIFSDIKATVTEELIESDDFMKQAENVAEATSPGSVFSQLAPPTKKAHTVQTEDNEAKFAQLFAQDLQRHQKDAYQAKERDGQVQSDMVYTDNLSTKSVGIDGKNERAYRFNRIVAFNNGSGEYHDDGEVLQLKSKRSKVAKDAILLLEWKEEEPGEYLKDRFTWQCMSLSFGKKKENHPQVDYLELQEGVSVQIVCFLS